MHVRTAMGASFVALFLILAIPMMTPGRSVVGFPVFIATTRSECGDGRPIIVDVTDEHWLRINAEPPLQTHELERRLHEIFSTRAEAGVFIKGNGDLPFRRIADVIDIASRQADHVVILTPAVEGKECVTYNPSPASPSLRAAFNRR